VETPLQGKPPGIPHLWGRLIYSRSFFLPLFTNVLVGRCSRKSIGPCDERTNLSSKHLLLVWTTGAVM
jgi:hypothetical protein